MYICIVFKIFNVDPVMYENMEVKMPIEADMYGLEEILEMEVN